MCLLRQRTVVQSKLLLLLSTLSLLIPSIGMRLQQNVEMTHTHTHTHSYWNRLEMYCRDLTKRHNEVSITSGPLFLPEKDNESGKRFVKYEVSLDHRTSESEIDSFVH